MVYIPSDMLPLILSNMTPPKTSPTIYVARTPVPAFTAHGFGRLRENIFSLLVYLQTHPVKVPQNKLTLAGQDRQGLGECLLPPPISTISLDTELDFLLHLAHRAKLLIIAHGRLRPEREATRTWLQSDAATQVIQLQNSWRADPTWTLSTMARVSMPKRSVTFLNLFIPLRIRGAVWVYIFHGNWLNVTRPI